MWVGEILVVLVIITVGLTLAYRVQVEARLRRHAEAVSTRLSASESRFRALFETAGDAIVVLDRQGFIVSANSAASSLLGTPAPQNLLSQHIGSWILSWQDFPQVCRESQVNGPARVSIKRSDGRELTAEVVLTALPRGIEKEGFQAVLRDATVREMREKGLRSLVHQIIQAQEEERERIARELHDDFLQTLILLTRELESIADIPGMPEEGKTRLARMASLAGSSGENLRSFSRDLRPSILNDLGLVPAIDWLMKDLAKRANLDAHFRVEGLNRRLSHYIELALFRIAQEALRNVEKHAHATRVEATLSFKPSLVTLTISDNGLGFSPPSTFEELVPRGKLGLVGLKERVSLLGGTIQLSSAPGKGTRLSVEILG
jgi:PAS domain S-box-containing protein